MAALEPVAFVALLGVTSRWVLAPVRTARRTESAPPAGDVVALEAERDARLAAVRDAELDLQTGKLSADDHRTLDAQLRGEALEALQALDAARGRDAEPR